MNLEEFHRRESRRIPPQNLALIILYLISFFILGQL